MKMGEELYGKDECPSCGQTVEILKYYGQGRAMCAPCFNRDYAFAFGEVSCPKLGEELDK